MAGKKKLTAKRKYKILLQIAQQTQDTFDLEQILNILLDELEGLVEYDSAGIFVLNRTVLPPRLQAPRQMIAKVVVRNFELEAERSRMMRYGEGLVGYAIRTGECVVIPDVSKDPRYEAGRPATRSEIVVPIFRGTRSIGALNLESDRIGAFSKADVPLLRFFAYASAITLERAILHQEMLEKEQLDHQLKTAQAVQSHLLPPSPPSLPGYDMAGLSIPAFAIGGDYYDFITLPRNQIGLVTADVSGDGVPAALVMASFRAMLRAFILRELDPTQITETINRMLADFAGQSDFVSCFYGLLDPGSGCMNYVNCGHNPPVYLTAGGDIKALDWSGPALGLFPGARYPASKLELAPGDLMVLYTDGLTEARNAEGEFFEVERLEAILRLNRSLPADGMTQVIIREARRFTGSEVFSDDVTLMVVKREG